LNLSGAVSAHAAQRPDAAALLTPTRRMGYAELDMMAWKVATYLFRRGVRAGDRVAIILIDNMAHAVTLLALVRLGAAQYGLSALDTVSTRQATVQRLDLKWIVGDAPPADVSLPHIPIDPTLHAYASIEIDRSAQSDDENQPWLAMMSSGTTGAPKAFLLTHAHTAGRYNTYRAAIPLEPGHRFLSLVELSFGSARQRTLYSFLAGGTVVLPDLAIQSINLRLINNSNIDIVFSTPFHLSLLLKLVRPESPNPLLPGVSMLVCSTSEVGEGLREAVRRAVSPNLMVAYGSSEVGYVAAGRGAAQAAVPGSVGFPLPGVTLELVDNGEIIRQPGITGLIRVRAPFLIDGYLDDPAMTREYFKGGWFYPGDLGAWSPDGQLIFKGRADDMMLHDGINIYPAEIEQVLLQHAAVAEAAAFSIKSQIHRDVPAAAVVLSRQATPQILLDFSKELLGVRAPRVIMIMDALPRSPAGKVLRTALAKQYQQATSSQ
jgi:acyl-coenzyme A synthetase/AMP-(fatty) acid ligase